MEEIGLFPLGVVLLPTELVPLHIFEPRYRELIGECLELGREFGFVFADEDGVREVGTRARVAEVIERYDDGRLDVVVEGGARFRVDQLTRGRVFLTALVEAFDDDEATDSDEAEAARAAAAFRALAAAVGAEPGEPDERSSQLSYELAAHVELAVEAKQRLLELRSERERIALVGDLLDGALEVVTATRELDERAKRNGTRHAG